MTLTAPAHLRVYERRQPLAREHHDARRDWIIEQRRAGHKTRDIAAALGVAMSLPETIISQARKDGILPPYVKPPPKPRLTAKLEPVADTAVPASEQRDPAKRVVICGTDRVTLARIPGEDAEGVLCTHRPETNPRFSLVRMSPTTERRTDVNGVIAAIRREAERFAATSHRNDRA